MNKWFFIKVGGLLLLIGFLMLYVQAIRNTERLNAIRNAENSPALVGDGDNVAPKGFNVYEFGGQGFLYLHDKNGDAISVEIRYHEASGNKPEICIRWIDESFVKCKFPAINEIVTLEDASSSPIFGSITIESPALNVVSIKIRTIRPPLFTSP